MEGSKKEVPVQFVRKYALVEHVCPVCRKRFSAPRVRRYCSKVCSRKAAWQRNGAKWNAHRKEKQERAAAQEIAEE